MINEFLKTHITLSKTKNGSKNSLTGLKIDLFVSSEKTVSKFLDFINERARKVSTGRTDKSVRRKIRYNVRNQMDTFNTEDHFIDPFIR